MKILPAIDLMDGRCVRLKQGDYSRRIDYASEPLQMARLFERMGYEWLHIVDLDGARAGETQNMQVIRELVEASNLKIQVGGGVRSFERIQELIELGVSRLMIGTLAVKEPEVIARAVDAFGPEAIMPAMDVKDGKIRISGWEETAQVSLADFVGKMIDAGVQNMLATNINRDGMSGGVDVAFYADLVQRFPEIQWVAAGGIRTQHDRNALEKLGVSAAVMGSIFYEGTQLTKRVIACLDVDNGRTVKGVNFEGLRDAGDPVELARIYADQGVDELCFLDITASSDKRKTVVDLVRAVAKEVNIPFTVGGGIRSLEDIRAVLEAGADKVSMSSAIVKNPELINEASAEFGAQCLVASLDVKRVDGQFRVTAKGGRELTNLDAVEWAKEVCDRGVGEILLNSMDADGTKAGFDLEMTAAIKEVASVPVIASGGAGSIADFEQLFSSNVADAVLAASIFHFGEVEISELKNALLSKNLPVRP